MNAVSCRSSALWESLEPRSQAMPSELSLLMLRSSSSLLGALGAMINPPDAPAEAEATLLRATQARIEQERRLEQVHYGGSTLPLLRTRPLTRCLWFCCLR